MYIYIYIYINIIYIYIILYNIRHTEKILFYIIRNDAYGIVIKYEI